MSSENINVEEQGGDEIASLRQELAALMAEARDTLKAQTAEKNARTDEQRELERLQSEIARDEATLKNRRQGEQYPAEAAKRLAASKARVKELQEREKNERVSKANAERWFRANIAFGDFGEWWEREGRVKWQRERSLEAKLEYARKQGMYRSL
jgi:hypothetical protein